MEPPPPPPQPVLAAGQGTGPSRRWYLISFGVLVLLFVPSLLVFLNGFEAITRGLVRVPVPGETPVELEEGTWTVFYEYRGVFDGSSFASRRQAPALDARLMSEEGELISVVPSNARFTYNWFDRSGYSIGKFELDRGGRYVFQSRLVDPGATDRYVLALGKDMGRSTLQLVFGLFGMMGSGLISFIVWLVIFILRFRAKRRMPGAV